MTTLNASKAPTQNPAHLGGTPYSQADFEQNPGKYELYRTACIAESIASLPELPAGTIVSIRYHTTRLNQARGKVEMPIYLVWPADNEELKSQPAMLYACALKDFCL